MLESVWNFFKRFFMKDYNKALSVGLQVMNAIDGILEEGKTCSDDTKVTLFPIYIRRGGKKWTINVTIDCEVVK